MKKHLHKGKYRLVATQQQKTNGQKQTNTMAIKKYYKHLKNITKIYKYKKLNSTLRRNTKQNKTKLWGTKQ